jgi:5-formyltetrahydrofolate cyclo-ligase
VPITRTRTQRPTVSPTVAGVPPSGDELADAKSLLRGRLSASRRERSAAARQAAQAAVTTHLTARLAGLPCVAAFLPLATEPLPLRALDLLARSSRILVPVVTGAAPLDWCEYPGPVRRGAFGIDEPAGPRLGAEAIADVDAVLVPALAVDRRGHRLGRGGGHYDRTLALLATLHRSPPPARIALIYDDELLDDVPVDALDQPVTAMITPHGGWQTAG